MRTYTRRLIEKREDVKKERQKNKKGETEAKKELSKKEQNQTQLVCRRSKI